MEKIGKILVEMGIINEEQLAKAVAKARKTGAMFGQTLIDLGYITEEQLLSALGKQLGIPYYPNLKNIKIPDEVIKAVPVKIVWHYKFMPLSLEEGVLKLAISDPHEIWSTEDIKLVLGYSTETVLAPSKAILEAISKYYGIGADTVQRILEKKEPEKEKKEKPVEQKVRDIEKSAGEASVVKLVEQILMSGIKSQATDIHFEQYRGKIKIRCRVDGILCDLALPKEIAVLYPAIVSRVKIISGLDVVEKRIPQDGRVKIKFHGNAVDLRVSIIPVAHGENIVIRILPGHMIYDLGELGFSADELKKMKELIHLPVGLIFLAGPTGSGKTTTLYACLSEIKNPDIKIITIEDPMEYEMEDIMQIPIVPKVGLTFASCLRSVLRHDPDIAMVGEVRDSETAELAVRSALTGHLILSTIHTNDATSGVARLKDMGIETFLLVSAVKAFVAQRLVRVVCDKCKTVNDVPYVSPDKKTVIKKHYTGNGCEECRFTGYKGRTAIHEIFVIDKDMQELILKGASSQIIREKAKAGGMKTLRDNGWEKVREAVTTIEEVLRVTETD
ncbi:MAG: Flp pilus assembly complex ATPase component TadA [Candidatus Omnitrophica bacterium]|nr:Flp pilus assembly complex ATPase component TadA [Candidatus Omnitrophota bacterium]